MSNEPWDQTLKENRRTPTGPWSLAMVVAADPKTVRDTLLAGIEAEPEKKAMKATRHTEEIGDEFIRYRHGATFKESYKAVVLIEPQPDGRTRVSLNFENWIVKIKTFGSNPIENRNDIAAMQHAFVDALAPIADGAPVEHFPSRERK